MSGRDPFDPPLLPPARNGAARPVNPALDATPARANRLLAFMFIMFVLIVVVLIFVLLLWGVRWGPITCQVPPTASSICDDWDPCTLDLITAEGYCLNPRVPAGTPCSHCECYTDTEATICDAHGQCVGEVCAGTCAEDEDCPALTFIGEAAEEGNNLIHCHRNASACQYTVKLDVPYPFDDFKFADCPQLPWAKDICWANVDPNDMTIGCLKLSTTCAETSIFFGNTHLYCHWHYGCSKWNPEVDSLDPE